MKFLKLTLIGHNAADAGAFDEAVEDDEQGPLIFVGKLIDFLIKPVQFRIMNLRFPTGDGPGEVTE
jgi:hypothetical protein